MSGTTRHRSVMVTGAGSGIGRAVTERLLADGHRVYAGALGVAEVETINGYQRGRGTVQPVPLDVRDDASIAAAAKQVADDLGPRGTLDALANVAGIITNGPLLDLEPETFRQVLAVNLVGMHATTRSFMPLLRRATGARVINMSSASGRRTLPFTGAYSASKYGVEALSTAMRLEYAALGVHVTVVAPGLINTPMADKIEQDLLAVPSERAYAAPVRRFLERMRTSTANGVPLEKAVDTVVRAITTERPRARHEIHNDYLRDVVLLRSLPAAVRDRVVAKTLGLGGAGRGSAR